MKQSALWSYLRRDKKSVGGWLQRVDAEIIGAILDFQASNNIDGGCAEIGVHHGKSFIPLCLSLRANEHAVCIDIFDEQEKNRDRSGKGDLATFLSHMERFGIPRESRTIIKGSSEGLAPSQITDKTGPVRFFSVDGGHWMTIVKNDLQIAEQSLADGGVIALDDYCRVDWPDVTAGYHFWQQETDSDIVPFAAGSNKLYLCRKPFADRYRQCLKTPFLLRFAGSTYRSYVSDVDNYRVEHIYQDEAGFLIQAYQNVRLFYPRLIWLPGLIRRFTHPGRSRPV